MTQENSRARPVDVFFYGLYMDPDVLATKGVKPDSPRRGSVEGFALRLGAKATLLRAPGQLAHGMVYAITHAELAALYAGLDVYQPEAVMVRTELGVIVPALTMLLLDPPAPEEANPEYAAKLRLALTRLGFPAAAIAAVR